MEECDVKRMTESSLVMLLLSAWVFAIILILVIYGHAQIGIPG